MAEDGGDAEAVLAQFAQAGIDIDALAVATAAAKAREAFVEVVERAAERIADKSDALAHAS